MKVIITFKDPRKAKHLFEHLKKEHHRLVARRIKLKR